MRIRPFYFIIALLLFLILVELIYTRLIFSSERTVYLMGTPVRIRIQGVNSPHHARLAFDRIWWIDHEFSRFREDSQVTLLNRLAGRAPLEVSRDVFECIHLANQVSNLSGGAFDLTRGHVRTLRLNHRANSVFITRKGISIDLGGIGKGFAAQKARQLLMAKGAKSGMIDMRSSIAVFGPRAWKVGVQHPRQKGRLLGVVELKDGDSLATSGDYERGEHIIDPRTGRPASACQSVTVIGKNAAVTDALSTAVFVLGPAQGLDLVESLPEVEALIVDHRGRIIKSSGFKLLEK